MVADEDVGAALTVDEVACVAADEDVVAGAADNRVDERSRAPAAEPARAGGDGVEILNVPLGDAAAAAVEELAFVADDDVVAGAGIDVVTAEVTDNDVVAGAAVKDVIESATVDRVVAGGAQDRHGNRGSGGIENVIVLFTVNGELGARGDRACTDDGVVVAVAGVDPVVHAAFEIEDGEVIAAGAGDDVEAVGERAAVAGAIEDVARGHAGDLQEVAADLLDHGVAGRIALVIDGQPVGARLGIDAHVAEIVLDGGRVGRDGVHGGSFVGQTERVVAGGRVDEHLTAGTAEAVADADLIAARAQQHSQRLDIAVADVDAVEVQSGYGQRLEAIRHARDRPDRVAGRSGLEGPGAVADARVTGDSIAVEVVFDLGNQTAGVFEACCRVLSTGFAQDIDGDATHVPQELVLLIELRSELVEVGCSRSDRGLDGSEGGAQVADRLIQRVRIRGGPGAVGDRIAATFDCRLPVRQGRQVSRITGVIQLVGLAVAEEPIDRHPVSCDQGVVRVRESVRRLDPQLVEEIDHRNVVVDDGINHGLVRRQRGELGGVLGLQRDQVHQFASVVEGLDVGEVLRLEGFEIEARLEVALGSLESQHVPVHGTEVGVLRAPVVGEMPGDLIRLLISVDDVEVIAVVEERQSLGPGGRGQGCEGIGLVEPGGTGNGVPQIQGRLQGWGLMGQQHVFDHTKAFQAHPPIPLAGSVGGCLQMVGQGRVGVLQTADSGGDVAGARRERLGLCDRGVEHGKRGGGVGSDAAGNRLEGAGDAGVGISQHDGSGSEIAPGVRIGRIELCIGEPVRSAGARIGEIRLEQQLGAVPGRHELRPLLLQVPAAIRQVLQEV